MDNDIKLSLGWCAAVAALALTLASCKDTPSPDSGATVTIPAGIHAFTGPNATGHPCGHTTHRIEAGVRAAAPGGWVAIDTDIFAWAAELAPACSHTTRVWIDSDEVGRP